MKKTHINFAVSENGVVCNILGEDIKARMLTRRDPKRRSKYRELKIIGASPAITSFMKKYPQIFKNGKLIQPNGKNFCQGLVPIISLSEREEQSDRLKNIMRYEYDIPEEELPEVEEFLDDFNSLSSEPEIKEMIQETVEYKNSIEGIWRGNENQIMQHIYSVLGYEPKDFGKVRTFIMYPNVNTHRMYPLTKNNTFLFFGKREETDPNKILAYLTHQAVHQPMLPYKASMTKEKRELFHGFIKFLADKETYSFLTGKSYLDIVTEGENPDVMGKIYPFWLGYKHRNDKKQGLDPAEEIQKEIDRDRAYYNRLKDGSKKKNKANSYNFDAISAEKIADFFKGKKGITPYDFGEIDFDNKKLVYKDSYLPAYSSDGR